MYDRISTQLTYFHRFEQTGIEPAVTRLPFTLTTAANSTLETTTGRPAARPCDILPAKYLAVRSNLTSSYSLLFGEDGRQKEQNELDIHNDQHRYPHVAASYNRADVEDPGYL